MTTDDSMLEGLDPYALLEQEAAHIEAGLTAMSDERWDDASRCAGWTVRDVLCHLAATEQYHQACLAHDVQSLFATGAELGLTSLGDWNEYGVRSFDGVPTADVLARWRTAAAESRAGFLAADGTEIDSSVGPYPGRWQAFHVASELAIHADDMHLPVADHDRDARQAWRARVSRFALAEAKPELTVTSGDAVTTVTSGATSVTVDDATLIEAVAGRLPVGELEDSERALLSTTP